MKNEQGNALITVLLISLIFTILGLSIIASAIGGAKRTETRESDIDLTYSSIKVLENMTADLSRSLSALDLEDYMNYDQKKVESGYNTRLHSILEDVLEESRAENAAQLECLNIIDISEGSEVPIDPAVSCGKQLSFDQADYAIEIGSDFTRVLDLVLVTNNPQETEGEISRTIKKRIILSPLPSFLKYAVGSESDEEDSGLFLNGSPNIVGNTYANRLYIDEDAHYEVDGGTEKTHGTPMPSLMGDLFSSSSHLLDIVKDEDNFYKGDIPPLKHDSQFFNIDYDKTFRQSLRDMLKDTEISQSVADEGTSFKEKLRSEISALPVRAYEITEDGFVKVIEGQSSPLSTLGDNITPTAGSYIIDSSEQGLYISDDFKIYGNLVVMSTQNPITFGGKLIVEGDLYLTSYQNLTLMDNVYVTGKTYILNLNGKLDMEKKVISADSIMAESHEGAKLKAKGDILTGESLTIQPSHTSIEFSENIIAANEFTVKGENSDAGQEDDAVKFDSVVYAGGKASISNANILGLSKDGEEQQIILMAKQDLMITRIDEFNNYNDTDEGKKPYLPENDSKIKPLKGFFYTEENAVLYGVGSLFYINGGIFAKENLTINAIRGEVGSNIDNLPTLTQEGKFSRFVVKYDQDVLLKRIELLPLAEQLQIFSDELLVE
ncbi:hypothetical protein ACQCVO_01915 [Bacillus infantis]|uniref:hypothetical protein n=1 Tax=Bacillus infantis TaxID=324767 RepID=UPI003CEF2F45